MTFPTAEFSLNRQFELPQNALWHLLTDPKEREAWSGPEEGMVLAVERADFREGGEERHRCGPIDAPEFFIDTRWYRINAPEAACFTETLSVQGARIFTSLVTYRLSAAGASTQLDVHVAITSFESPDAFAEVEAVWTSALDRLSKLKISA